jgi:lysophospholipase L1-like esterase
MSSAVLLLAVAGCGGGGGGHLADAARDVASDAPPPILEPIHFYGRWDATPASGWPGSAIAARFSGTGLQAMVHETGDDWLEVTIDGTAQPAVHLTNGTQTITLAAGLAVGEHEVLVAKRTESYVGTLRFDGFVGATLIPSPRATRTIELIGDSITAGYGVLGTSPCAFSDATEAEPHAWGALAATQLNAAHLAIAYSGIGMYRNCCNGQPPGGDTMPVRYGRTFADQAGSTWDFHEVPDVVVIGLGTNDFNGGDPGLGFETAYEAFIADQVRPHAPGVPILLATSAMLGGTEHAAHRARLDAIAAHFADPKIAVVEIPEQLQADGYGCDYHPNEVTARKMADALVPAIRAATSW